MNLNRIFFRVLVLSLCFTASTAFAAAPSDAMLQIAKIMHRLKHFPSPQGKSTLQELENSETTTANEKIIIRAILNLQHHPTAEDKEKLSALLQDPKANNYEHSVATIVFNLDHRPTKEDKAILSKIIGK